MVFSKEAIACSDTWKWGDKEIPRVVSYCYLGIDLAENGSWDSHVQKVQYSCKEVSFGAPSFFRVW